MNLDKYKELSGTNVETSDETRVTAVIARTRYLLEAMLGFTLDTSKTNKNFYNETGKSPIECSCLDIDTTNLLAPDDIIGSYRLFRYNKDDVYCLTDPFVNVHKVKLVYIGQGYSEESSITVKTFDFDEIRVQYQSDFGKYIQFIYNTFKCCGCDENNVQIAIDADWLYEGCIPRDLQYVWTDMITFYSDLKSDIKSESITGHSYTKFERVLPEEIAQNISIIKKYAGPNGSVTTFPI